MAIGKKNMTWYMGKKDTNFGNMGLEIPNSHVLKTALQSEEENFLLKIRDT